MPIDDFGTFQMRVKIVEARGRMNERGPTDLGVALVQAKMCRNKNVKKLNYESFNTCQNTFVTMVMCC